MAAIPGYTLYNGAAITRVVDGSDAVWIGCCAKNSAGRFGFYLFRNGIEMPYTPFCTARGTIRDDGWWIAFEGAAYHTGAIPGFVPLPHRAALPIAPDSPIAALWHGAYTAQDTDTPAEVALRIGKQLAAINQLVELLITAGVATRA